MPIVIFSSLVIVAVFFTSCANKQQNNGKFDCKCDCNKNSFECKLEIDKETKILHNEEPTNEEEE